MTDHKDTELEQVLRNVTVQQLSIQFCTCCDVADMFVSDMFVCVLEILCRALCHYSRFAMLCCAAAFQIELIKLCIEQMVETQTT